MTEQGWTATDRGATAIRVPSCRILLVDDCEEVLELIADGLGDLGYDVTTASDGITALAIAEQIRPHLVLLDLQLPRLGGWEVARRLRARFGRAVFLAALTGWSASGDRQRSKAAGFDVHLTKPTPLADLRALADDVMRRALEPSDRAG